jgi:hypothetical protein
MRRYLFKAAFNKLWRLSGKPTLTLIEPISAWTLPVGVAWDSHYNQFVDEDGIGVEVVWRGQPATTLPFLPRRGNKDVRLEAIGVVTIETTNVTLLWSGTAQTKVELAWGVDIGDRLYRIRHWDLKPLGVTSPNEIELSLVEGD